MRKGRGFFSFVLFTVFVFSQGGWWKETETSLPPYQEYESTIQD